MLDKFLSNKVESTLENWTDGLILVASIFSDFDGLTYSRSEFENAFETISPRLPDKRDASNYRDKYSAYGSFLGIVNYASVNQRWVSRVNPTAKELLCSELPDPQAYVRLQMSLLQYPNPIGGKYKENGTLAVESLSQAKRVQQVKSGIRTVPFRLLLRVLLALHDETDPSQAFLTNAEIWHCLFNKIEAVGTPDPDGSFLARQILAFRSNPILLSHNTEAVRNLHILNHTGLVSRPKNSHTLRLLPQSGNPNSVSGKIAREIAAMTGYFDVPVPNASETTIKDWAKNALESGNWATYYGGGNLPATMAAIIKESISEVDNSLLNDPAYGPGAPLLDFQRERTVRSTRLERRPANLQETEALREKANLAHREIVKLLADRMRAQGMIPESNIFIDLASRSQKKMLFEIKSCRPENLLSQVRKGISQLYEYRYRHNDLAQAKLVLALESRPTEPLDWLVNYLVGDRSIAVCWLEGNDNLACPSWCEDCLGNLVNRIEPFPD